LAAVIVRFPTAHLLLDIKALKALSQQFVDDIA